MAFCDQCGSRLPEGAQTCPSCGAPVSLNQQGRPTHENQKQYSEQEGYQQNAHDTNEQSQKNQAQSYAPTGSVDRDFMLASGEKIVREYLCSNLRKPKCKGYLTVTNKRIIFHAKETSSRIEKEVVLDSVSGLDCFYGMNVSVLKVIVGLLLFFVGTKFLFESFILTLIGLAVMALGVLLMYSSMQKSFKLAVYSSKASGAPIHIGAGAQSLIGNGVLYSLTSAPTEDTDRMLSELGALIQDLQTLGDDAIEKWKN